MGAKIQESKNLSRALTLTPRDFSAIIFYMTTLALRYKALKSHKVFYFQLAVGFLLLAVSSLVSYWANNYTITHASFAVSDIILDNIRPVNVDYVFMGGGLGFILLLVGLAFYRPARLPFMLKAASLFILVRAFFIILTHLAPPAAMTFVSSDSLLERFTLGSGNDLFFSGHTGFPFLMALVFWNNKTLRYVFLAISLFFGGAVLLGHLHYSIDVFSAFFITYGIYRIALYFFKKDYQLFEEAESE